MPRTQKQIDKIIHNDIEYILIDSTADHNGGSSSGTITGVTAGTGLTGGGTTGTVTISHSNQSGLTAKTTQAVYPITFNVQGHITGSGSAVTIPSVPSAGSTASAVSTTSSGGSATTWSKSDHVHNITDTTIRNALGFTPISGITSSDVTTALGYTPLSTITSSNVTTALGYTPYNGATNPNGYVTTDTKVTQTNTTDSANYRVLLSANANNTT